jgi:hypothetical protein
MKVNHINGTSGNTCKCGSWLRHWRKHGGSLPQSYCAEKSCMKTQEVGAHVQKDSDSSWYIVPLCQGHNAQTGSSIELMDGTTLVRANVSLTCG